MDTMLIDRTFPLIGDSGGHPVYKRSPRQSYHDADNNAFEHIYRYTKDPKFAWALVHAPGWSPSLNFPYTRAQIEKEAAKLPDDWNDASSLHDGYGIAILRDGKGDNKRALWMMYGRARGHIQDNLMDIGLAAHEGTLLAHMGYPRNWGYWEHSWTSHHVARMWPYLSMTSQAQLFADAGVAQVCEARAAAHSEYGDDGAKAPEPADYWQRRMLALVNVGPEQFYCVDLYRISGGKEHWWSFPCQEGEVTTTGLNLVAQPGGTLAGPDVPYGDEEMAQGQRLRLRAATAGAASTSPSRISTTSRRPSPRASGPRTGSSRAVTACTFRLTVPQAEGMEVSLSDGKSPAGGSPYEMKWLMLHKQAEEPARSQVLGIMEPYLDQAADPGGPQPRALRC